MFGRWTHRNQEFTASSSHIEFEINLGYRRFCHKQKNRTIIKKQKQKLREGVKEDGVS